MEHLNRADNPPPTPTAQIWTPKSGRHHAIILAPWVGLWVHWMPGKYSLPCLGETCPRVRHLRPARWCGYLPVAQVTRAAGDTGELVTCYRAAILAVGPDLAAELRPHLADYPGPGITLERVGKAKTLHLCGAGPVPEGITLPATPDPWATLYRVWGLIPPCDGVEKFVE